MISSGVLIRESSAPQHRMPAAISAAHSAAAAISVVVTAVFICLYSLAPNSWETITEQPMLQPKAKAMKIRVIS